MPKVNPAPVSRDSDMRIAIFSHDANPAIDRPVYKLSYLRAVEAVKAGEIFMVSERSAQKYPPAPPDEELPMKRQPSPSSLTCSEMEANVGGAAYMAVVAAQAKVRVWPHVGDDLAVRVGIRV